MADGPEASISPSSSSPASAPPPLSSTDSRDASQVPSTLSFPSSHHAAAQTFPFMFPPILSGFAAQQSLEQVDHGPGIYAIPAQPYLEPMAGLPAGSLIPLTYKIPMRSNSSGSAAGEHGLDRRQQNGPQRQIVERRFHFAFQLDLGLILKLAAIVFLFSQEGSRMRLIFLVFFASLMYLYHTGVLAPLVRWMRRGALLQPRRPVQQDNARPVAPEAGNAGGDDQNQQRQQQQQPTDSENLPAADENPQEPERRDQANHLWLIFKEIQMFVVGFFTSLLPGFHHND